MTQLDTKYDPKLTENKWTKFWEEKKYARGDENLEADSFSIVIPPPNVTGSLHIGHAFNNTLQDILTRWKRMSGYNTLWQPGMDHAGIATQNVIERQLKAEGSDRETLGREKFIERIWKWKEESGGNISHQLVRLGGSMDWERERFTMDEGLSKAVKEVFVTLYEEGLIYKGDYIINWCPRCQTALSDLEVEHEEKPGHLYHLKYYFSGEDDFLTIATTRPETLLGDSAVAINPTDQRYSDCKGKTVQLPILERTLPIIEDSYVDIEFGTGALKVTPAHDPNDFEIGQRHNLPSINVMNPDGTMNEEAGVYKGLDRFECRKKLVGDLTEKKILVKIEDITHSVGHCYRCQTLVEPFLSKQWFVKAKPLAQPAIEAVKSGDIKIVPKFWENTYFEWMENIRDWCISRQIWWGHQIPAWTCDGCEKTIVAKETPNQCDACGGSNLTQDPDVLDTWFSSALWPFSTLGWPDKTKSLELYYPTSVLVTGFDILFFWVARMIMMGLKFQGDVPFKHVYIHALIRDSEGQKMSKTKGNVIDPLVMMDKFGTDALRFTLAAFAAQGRDVKLAEDRIEGYRNFCNKLWNASRFALMNLEDYKGNCNLADNLEFDLTDRWILSRLNETCREVEQAFTDFKFNEASGAIYRFIWREFCDWYIELSKPRLFSKDEDRIVAQNVLAHVLESCLKLLHPIMPFITEEIWQKLPVEGEAVMIAPFPKYQSSREDGNAETTMDLIMDVVTAVRNIRGEMNINPGRKLDLLIEAKEAKIREIIENNVHYIKDIAKAKSVSISTCQVKPEIAASVVLSQIDLIVPLKGVVDFEEEEKRIEKELKKIEKDLIVLNEKLSNPNFVKKAPQEVIEKDRGRQTELSEKQSKLLAHLRTVKQGIA
jgi:valyl-tRNA synthetase